MKKKSLLLSPLFVLGAGVALLAGCSTATNAQLEVDGKTALAFETSSVAALLTPSTGTALSAPTLLMPKAAVDTSSEDTSMVTTDFTAIIAQADAMISNGVGLTMTSLSSDRADYDYFDQVTFINFDGTQGTIGLYYNYVNRESKTFRTAVNNGYHYGSGKTEQNGSATMVKTGGKNAVGDESNSNISDVTSESTETSEATSTDNSELTGDTSHTKSKIEGIALLDDNEYPFYARLDSCSYGDFSRDSMRLYVLTGTDSFITVQENAAYDTDGQIHNEYRYQIIEDGFLQYEYRLQSSVGEDWNLGRVVLVQDGVRYMIKEYEDNGDTFFQVNYFDKTNKEHDLALYQKVTQDDGAGNQTVSYILVTA